MKKQIYILLVLSLVIAVCGGGQLLSLNSRVASAGTVALKNVYVSTSIDGKQCGTLTTDCKSSLTIPNIDIKSCFGSHPEYYHYTCSLYAASSNSLYSTNYIGSHLTVYNFDGVGSGSLGNAAFKLINVFGSSAATELVEYCADKADKSVYLHLQLKATAKSAQVACEDRVVSASGAMLGSSSWTAGMGTMAYGSTKGSNQAAGAYYKGYVYSSCSSAEVGTEGCKVYRYFTPVTSSVSLTGGTGIASVSGSGNRSYGSAVSVSASVKTGYHFTGWSGSYTNQSNPFSFSMPDFAVSLTANAAANSYTIAFDGNGATAGQMNEQTFAYDSPKTLYANSFVRKGHTFQGWSLSASGKTAYMDKQSILNLTANQGDKITLYAVWSKNSYQITFHANGGTCNVKSKSVPYGSQIGWLPTPDRLGYTFVGWYTEELKGRQIVETTAVDFEQNQTYYAHWKANTYTVVFQPNGGNGSASATMPAISVQYDTEVSLPVNRYERSGYYFAGWSDHPDGEGELLLEESAVVKNMTAQDGGVITLYACWEPISYTIVFYANGGDGSMREMVMEYDREEELPFCRYEREDYEFVGWSDHPEGDEIVYEDGESVCNLTEIQDDIVPLYAVWREKASGEVETPKESTMPVESGTPEGPLKPRETGVPEETGPPEETDDPRETGSPEETGAPRETGSPEETDAPRETESPEGTGIPIGTGSPVQTGIPESGEIGEPDQTVVPSDVSGGSAELLSPAGILSTNVSQQENGVSSASSPVSGLNVGESTVIKPDQVQNLGEKDNPVIDYSSSDHSIAYVDEQGNLILTGKDGVASIRTTLSDGTVKQYTVTTANGVTSVTLEKGTVKKAKLVLGKKEKVVLKYSVYKYLDGTSSNRKIATVKSTAKKLTIRGKKKGQATITVEYENGMTGQIKVQVKKAPKKIKAKNMSMSVGKTKKMSVRYNKGAYSNKKTYRVMKGKENVSVSKDGKIVGLKKGSAKIMVVSYNGKKRTAVVNVH